MFQILFTRNGRLQILVLLKFDFWSAEVDLFRWLPIKLGRLVAYDRTARRFAIAYRFYTLAVWRILNEC